MENNKEPGDSFFFFAYLGNQDNLTKINNVNLPELKNFLESCHVTKICLTQVIKCC